MTDASSLEIHLHLINGHIDTFVQDDPEKVQKIVEEIGKGKVFSQPSLVINGQEAVAAYHGPSVARIDLLIDPLPAFLLPAADDPGLWEISAEEWQRRHPLRIDKAAQREELRTEGQPFVAFAEVRLEGGGHFFLEVRARAGDGLQQRQFLHHIFSLPSLSCRRRGGGLTLWNPARMVNFTAYPGPPGVPANAWPAERLRAST